MSKINLKAFAKKEGLSKGKIKELHLLAEAGDWKYKHPPVSMKVFLENSLYLGWNKESVYPKVKEILIELNSGDYYEAVLTGGIGVAKTTIAIYSTLFQLYLLSCLENPQKEYMLDPASEIVIIFQNINKEKAINADFNRFKSLVEKAPYFNNIFPPEKSIQSELIFLNNIVVRPVSGAISATMGENIYGGMLDEVNFMENVGKSKKSVDGQEYDQADALYNSVARRRESRFFRDDVLPGLLCMASSKRCPDDFTERKIEEAKTDLGIFIYDKKIWEIKPEGTFSGNKFKVFIGSLTKKPKILDPGEIDASCGQGQILEVPENFRKQFEMDLVRALREIGGVSFRSKFSFFPNFEKVLDCFGSCTSILNFDSVNFEDHRVKIVNKIANPNFLRWVHIDLGLTRDHAGVVMGHVSKFIKRNRGEGVVETLPFVEVDFVLNIAPPKNGEIEFSKIRELIYRLVKNGVRIKYVSLDSYQSADTIQQLRRKGINSGLFSVDKDPKAYLLLKETLSGRRIIVPSHERLIDELRSLEWDEFKRKVDHPPIKSKDLSDSLAAVVFNLSMSREIWYREHNISPRDANLFLSSQSGGGTSFGNGNIAGLGKGQSVKDVIFSGEGIVTSDEDPSILTDLGFT